jgi:hypothetical protein
MIGAILMEIGVGEVLTHVLNFGIKGDYSAAI